MAASARIDELRSKFDENPRRYFAPLANEYRKAGDLSTAVAICRTQLRLFPTHMSGNVVLGQALFEAGELAEAQRVFERAIVLDPENLIALRHLGDIARATPDAPAARMWYRRVLDADPYNETIASALAELDEPPAAPAASTDELIPALPSAVSAAEEAEVVVAADEEPPEIPDAQFVEFSETDFVWAPEPEPDVPALDPVVGLDLPPEDVEQAVEVAEPAPAIDLLPSGAFATETMARLCLEQGHDAEALAIYERLAAQRPDDTALRERIAALRTRLYPDVQSTATAGAFLRRLAEPNDRDEWAARSWEGAFDEPAPLELSFDRFFVGLEESPAPAPPAPPHVDFVEMPAPSRRATPQSVAVASEPPVESEEDLAEFNAWLNGLRDP